MPDGLTVVFPRFYFGFETGAPRLGCCQEIKRHAVVAPAFARGLWPVGEDMSLVAHAAGAVIFHPRPAVTKIALGSHGFGYDGKETRPAGATVVFHFGAEQRQIAARADEYSRLLFIVQWAGECWLGAVLSQHFKLHRRQFLAPLSIRRQLTWPVRDN